MDPSPPDFDGDPDTGAVRLPVSPMAGVYHRLGAIETLEAERTGASKTTARYLLIFGGLGTALALAFLGMTWQANADDATRDAQIDRLDEKVGEHTDDVRELGGEVDDLADELGGLRASQKATDDRLDRLGPRIDALLDRLPVHPPRRGR